MKTEAIETCTIENNGIDAVLALFKGSGRQLVRNAYVLAEQAHRGQTRKRDGGTVPYIMHPVAVAHRLAQLGQPAEVVAAGVLHDTVEDCDVTLAEIQERFGAEVAFLVDGMTKVLSERKGPHIERDGSVSTDKDATFRKLLAYAHKDPRVLLVKLCDVAHNSSELYGLDLPAREKFAKHAVAFYAPLARALGQHELERSIRRDAGPWTTRQDDILLQYATPAELARLA